MQGKLAIAILLSVLAPSGALAGEVAKRATCPKVEPSQQRQQAKEQQQHQRTKSQGCPVQRQIPPLVDPTPRFFL